MCNRYTDAQCAICPHCFPECTGEAGVQCLVSVSSADAGVTRPSRQAVTHRSLCVTNTNANGLKISAGVYIIIVHSTITNAHSTGPIYKSRVCPHTFPECSVQLSPASSRSCSGAPRSPRCWPPPGCCSPSCRRTWAPPCALRPPAALQPQLILAARINTAEPLLLHSFFCCFEKLSSAGKSMNFPDRLKRCTGAISADVCTADIFGPIIGSIRPEILERFYITWFLYTLTNKRNWNNLLRN